MKKTKTKQKDDYTEFLKTKQAKVEAKGIEPGPISQVLFTWQQDIVKWALKMGRAAIFADCGMGKTLMQVEWARQIHCHMADYGNHRVLILAPLSVAQQTIQEAKKLDVTITYKTEPDDSTGIWITNYDRLHKFPAHLFDGIVLDESSILKSLDGKTRTLLLEQYTAIPYRLCCTATPSPNDQVELGNHAEFLGICKNSEMKSTFFINDAEGGQKWRLKGHAKKEFWKWVAQWAVYIRKPSDLGYDDGDFILPALNISQVAVDSNYIPECRLFPDMTKGIQGRTHARRHTMDKRIDQAIEIIKHSKDQWLVWCGLNDEGQKLAKALGQNKAVLIEGATDDESRTLYESCWRSGKVQTLITKPGMFGFGMNWQHCNKILFLGLGDSFEQWYQSVRRCWRFGQKKPVDVVIVTSDAEISVVENVQRKEKQASELAAGIVAAMKDAQIELVMGKMTRKDNYKMETKTGENWEMKLGDCVERIKEIETASVGLSIFSPPFSQLYTYSNSDRDMGNSKDHAAFFKHFGFLIPELLRVIKPGRRLCVHTQQIAQTLVRDGQIGLYDFRADLCAAIRKAGFIYDGEVVIWKNPQAQSIRTRTKALAFHQLEKDSVWMRPAMADYILLFRKPGENADPVKTDVTREEWIKYAEPFWTDIHESDTLQYQSAREHEDEKHICPLQLETIRRCVRLWSNPCDLVLSPFAGIGSEGHVALEQERRFVGIELKQSYFKQAVKNLQNAVKQESLFSAEVVNA